MKPLKIKLNILHPDFTMPVYSHPGDAGMDLFSLEEIILTQGERKKIPCGFSIEIPDGFFGAIAPRSGLANLYGITLVNSWGVIDSSYRGEICVIIINLGREKIALPPKTRIAQLLVIPVVSVELYEVKEKLIETDRGANGFGSTGL
ncbi:MAG TPA: dUTP diphosphatase [Caldisericia bacterium]|nr:dUTP diphosphatase [Caldisericia bacterium]